MFDEHSRVLLKRPLPSLGLEPGDVGVEVHNYGRGAAYELEFQTLDGNSHEFAADYLGRIVRF